MFKCTMEHKHFFCKMTCHFHPIYVAKSLHAKTLFFINSSHSCVRHNLLSMKSSQQRLHPTAQSLINPEGPYPLKALFLTILCSRVSLHNIDFTDKKISIYEVY